MRVISVGNGSIWKYRRITDKANVGKVISREAFCWHRIDSNWFQDFLWYIEENRCIMQGRDREKRGCTWEIHKKIPGAERKDEERWT